MSYTHIIFIYTNTIITIIVVTIITIIIIIVTIIVIIITIAMDVCMCIIGLQCLQYEHE